jgi:hypothetical protein
MFADTKPCRLCGAEVELREHRSDDPHGVAEPDATVDERVCTNPQCESHQPGRPAGAPTP